MSVLSDILGFVFPSLKKGSGTPADQKPHDARDNETVDMETGIGEESGQILDNTEIDPEIQDREKGFPK
jgi:hypothetical protein